MEFSSTFRRAFAQCVLTLLQLLTYIRKPATIKNNSLAGLLKFCLSSECGGGIYKSPRYNNLYHRYRSGQPAVSNMDKACVGLLSI